MNMIEKKTENGVVLAEKLIQSSPIALAFLVILTPHINLPSLPAIRLEQILILIVFLAEIYVYGFRRLKVIISRPMSYFVLGLGLFFILVMMNGYFSGYRIIYNDFFELFKLAIYYGAFLLIRLNVRSEAEKKELLRYIVFFVFISSVVAITQYFNFFNMNELYVRALAPTQFKTLVEGYPSPRVIGITANPNFFALFAGIAGFITFRDFISSARWKSLFLTIFFFIILNMTKSRTGFLFFVVGILMLFLMEGFRTIRRIKQEKGRKSASYAVMTLFVLLFLIAGSFAAFVAFGPESLTWRLKHGLDFRNDGSFLTRIRRWKEYISMFNIPQLIGVGPTKSVPIAFQVDNEWLIFLKEFGLMGTVLLAVTFVLPFIKNRISPYSDLYFVVIFAGGIFMLTSVFVSIHQVMPLVMILAALSRPVLFHKEEHAVESSIYY